MTFQTQECHEEALTHRQEAVNLAREHGGYPQGLAAALNSLGWGHALLGNAQQALTYSQQSLALFQDLGDRWGEAAALDTIGYAHHHLGRHRRAAGYLNKRSQSAGNSATSTPKPPIAITLAMPATPPETPPRPATPGSKPSTSSTRLATFPAQAPATPTQTRSAPNSATTTNLHASSARV